MAIKKLRKILNRFQNLSGKAHKPYVTILFEIFYWKIVLGEGIIYYFDYEIFLRGKRLGTYVVDSQFARLEKRLNSPEYYPIVEDKYFFYKISEGTGYRFPKNLFLVDPSGFYSFENRKYITEEEFLQRDLDGFLKLNNGYGGKMIYQIDIHNKHLRLNQKNTSLPELLTLIGHHKFLIQERIIQHDKMQALNPSCINTMRMLTIRTGQTIHLFQDYLRIGINNNYVDNGLSGNIFIGIQRDEGKLMKYAYSGRIDAPQYRLERHPQTNTTFQDFSIPFYKESVETVKSMHQLFQQFFMIGWDVGITPDGPIVIEGNNITTLFPFQVIYGGMKSSFYDLAESYQKNLLEIEREKGG
ncbi:MAG: sugar-transfer associated ATP-grasp domain-containing protein [Bacteroidales bacterium]